jgi:succinate dehydrogenase / fumarate reductase cytochrome b subunit
MYHDLAALIIAKFQIPLFVFGYILAFVFLGFHLHHGFQSAFQSLGLNHSKYTPVIKILSTIISVVLALGYICIPLAIYLGNY